jgi:hypothetical protein
MKDQWSNVEVKDKINKILTYLRMIKLTIGKIWKLKKILKMILKQIKILYFN